MKFPFYKFPHGAPGQWVSVPRILVGIGLPTSQASTDIYALLDSGADLNLFTAQIADIIGIGDLEKGEERKFQGITGGATAYGHAVRINVGGYDIITKVFFSRSVGPETMLLGMNGFFDKFTITFDKAKESIEIKPAKLN